MVVGSLKVSRVKGSLKMTDEGACQESKEAAYFRKLCENTPCTYKGIGKWGYLIEDEEGIIHECVRLDGENIWEISNN